MKVSSLSFLNDLGQSIWYDNLSKEVLDSGELKNLIDKGVSGLTSNPVIFKKAIAESSLYDAQIEVLTQKGLDTEQSCEELMCDDVGRAADLLLPIFENTDGRDGYASIEVSPLLAYNTEKTIEAGKRLWDKIDRPNLMIKVPATKEGIPAIRALLEAGINVNVTLIFSVERYEEVMNAYLDALETRHPQGKSLSRVASVASFFVSRVDSIVEKALEEKGLSSLKDSLNGKIGIANSREAYRAFLRVFTAERFTSLSVHGARVQRPLWASTGTKNPAFPPLLYVEALAVRDTVNTMPPQTLKVLLDTTLSSQKGISVNDAEDKALFQSLAQHEVVFSDLLVQLEQEGVKLFEQAYLELLTSIDDKKGALAKS